MIMMKHISKKVKPLQITLTKTNTYVNIYDEQIKQMYVLIENDDLLEKYKTIWEKDSVDIKNQFDSLSVFYTKNSQLPGKILNSREKFVTLKKILNSRRTFSTLEKTLKSREISQLMGKLSTVERILH